MPPKKKKHKKRVYKKSRYYRRRQQLTERLLIGCGAVLILLLLIILVRGCSARKNGAGLPLRQTPQRNHRMKLLPQMQTSRQRQPWLRYR